MNKKSGMILLMTLLMSTFLISSVSAVDWGAGKVGKSFVDVIDAFVKNIDPIAKYILGSTPTGELLFAKVLFMIIILSIVWLVLNKIDFFNETQWVLWGLSIIVSILAVRFLGAELIEAMILPYSTLGIAIGALVPFIIFFLVIETGLKGPEFKTIRRIAWIFFAVVFIGLWMARSDKIGSAAGIYLWTGIIGLILMLMDGTIQNFLLGLKLERAGVNNKADLITELKRKIQEADNDFKAGIFDTNERKKRQKRLKKQIAVLNK